MKSLPSKAKKIAEVIDRLIKEMHALGTASSLAVDAELATILSEILRDGIDVNDDFKVAEMMKSVNYEAPDNATRAAIQQNVTAFGVAKSVLEIQEMAELMLDDSGQIKSFAKFRKEVNEKTHQLYNQNWLKSEYNHVIAASQASANYNRLLENKDAMPYLTYRTVGDGRVRNSHANIDGVTRPVDDPFWDSYYPPNGWGCRCDVIATNNPAKLSDQTEADSKGASLNLKPQFKQNYAKTGQAFSQDHPITQAAGDMYQMEAVKDYQMKTAQDTMLGKRKFPTTGQPTTFDETWQALRKKRGHKTTDAVVLADRNANLVLVDKSVLQHSSNPHLVQDVLSKPSEIWLHKERIVRVKYYKEGAQVAITDRKNKLLNYHYFDVDDKNIEFYRNGIIMQR